ncbi:MAG: branched-chain amino acid ABC transporter permease [Deltaproteobacteria bacterium]|jgi:branched-chain amino acid transport system permease protein|nr:branched-chain amino acid ABC transporter permease [Deltaproteobacteria bacterium]MBW2468003.1 branched-chain amino acid ABC transporter permease [Deltaproteobacteria bacterium]MBW2488125.1 branched-chain amino acid ABC transporter permease [Deltaproteobacteria bacterium]MBW2517167.1 branched-chain amino acid ABC transporter permease [Deltaproteobacteria bacterium]
MEATSEKSSSASILSKLNIRAWASRVPLIGWLIGALIAVGLEMAIGTPLARGLGLPKAPVLFGFVIMLKKPLLIPGAALYLALIYLLPIGLVARFGAAALNRLAAVLADFSTLFSILIHLALLYLVLHLWSGLSDYRVLVVKLTLIAIMVTLSLNVINGYMGEFSCSHPGFMALGAYTTSVFTVSLFVNDKIFGAALLPEVIGPFFFPIALFLGGMAASIGAMVVAIPSFRTRGDYLAIISLAFLFIVKSLIENLEVVGGPRGLGSQPDWANLPTVFLVTVICIWIINNFVRSTLGKALNAVRDNEMAADAMTVNTRRTKFVAFLFAAFWAGVAGGLFAHVLRYVNPGTFGIQKLAEVLAMVYFGGLNSVYGAIVGATSISLLGEALRPLEIFKWIIIPLLLILVMIFRPTGLVAFKEFDVRQLIQPKK